jgi:uridine kinase
LFIAKLNNCYLNGVHKFRFAVMSSGLFISTSDHHVVSIDLTTGAWVDERGKFELSLKGDTKFNVQFPKLNGSQQVEFTWRGNTWVGNNQNTYKRYQTCPKCTLPMMIGVSGATRAGKGELSRQLQAKYNVPQVLCLDNCFISRRRVPKDLTSNWECPQVLDWDQFVNQLKVYKAQLTTQCMECRFTGDRQTAQAQNPTPVKKREVGIAEGFLLFAHAEVLRELDVKIFLSISKEVCYQRRMSTKRVSEEYFEKVLWPSYLRYNSHIFTVNGLAIDYLPEFSSLPYWPDDELYEFASSVTIIEGAEPLPVVFQTALKLITDQL